MRSNVSVYAIDPRALELRRRRPGRDTLCMRDRPNVDPIERGGGVFGFDSRLASTSRSQPAVLLPSTATTSDRHSNGSSRRAATTTSSDTRQRNRRSPESLARLMFACRVQASASSRARATSCRRSDPRILERHASRTRLSPNSSRCEGEAIGWISRCRRRRRGLPSGVPAELSLLLASPLPRAGLPLRVQAVAFRGQQRESRGAAGGRGARTIAHLRGAKWQIRRAYRARAAHVSTIAPGQGTAGPQGSTSG